MKKKLILGLFLWVASAMVMADSTWITGMEFKQDFRYRWQEEYKEDALTSASGDSFTRYRQRIRYRLGIDARANDEMLISARLATNGEGKTDALSTNDTMGEKAGFTKDTVILDQAYLQWNPAALSSETYGNLQFLFGKFDVKKSAPTFTDILWDSDISLEGTDIGYTWKNGDLNVLADIGNYTVLNNSISDSEILTAQQLGFGYKFGGMYKLESCYASYRNAHPAVGNLSGTTILDKSLNNTGIKLSLDTESRMPNIPVIKSITKVALVNDEYVNTNSDDKNKGRAYGVQLGTKAMSSLGDFDIKFFNRELQENAGWSYGDSDVYPAIGGTDATGYAGINTKGTELEIKFAIAPNASFSIDQYLISPIDDGLAGSYGLNKLTQFDVSVSF